MRKKDNEIVWEYLCRPVRNKEQKLSACILSTCETNRNMEISVSTIYVESISNITFLQKK